jgi:hypothetical protein
VNPDGQTGQAPPHPDTSPPRPPNGDGDAAKIILGIFIGGPVLLVFVVAVISFGAIGANIALRGSSGARSSNRDARTYRDRTLGLTIRYPGGFHAGHFRSRCCVDMADDGEWFANFGADIRGGPARVGNAGEVPDMTHLRGFPAQGVALAVWEAEGGVQVPETHPTTALPLAPRSLHVVRPYVGGSEPAPRYADIHDHGTDLAVVVWIGPDASSTDRRDIWSALASLRFLR